MGTLEMNAVQLIAAGGPLMWPILLCSVFSLGIIIERLSFFSSIKTNTYELKNKVFELIKRNELKEAMVLCEANRSPVAKIFKAGIAKFGSSREEIKEAMSDMSLFEIPNLEKRLTALATMAHTIPLLGLLGTVLGMANSFYGMQFRSTTMAPATPADLAGGIWQALLTTIAALVVTIPTMVAYNYCVSQANRFIADMERGATELVNFISQITETDSHKEHD